jgi:hypothetical protein
LRTDRPYSLVFALGVKFHVVCIQTGERARPLGQMNHWGLDVRTRDDVDEAFRAVQAMKDTHKIGAILPIELVGGRYSFYFEDLNQNWWEIQHYDGSLHDDFFDFGDQNMAPASPESGGQGPSR